VVKTVEASNIKFADVFLILIKMANMIKAMPIADTTLERLEFRKKCVSFYNKRWAEFDTDFYLLAYFLHPKYHGKGLVSEAFQIIYQKALTIWKSLDGEIIIHVGKIPTYYSLGFVRHPKSQIPNSSITNISKTLLIIFI